MKQRRRDLALHQSPMSTVPATVLTPPTGRGRLWYDFQIPKEFFEDLPNIKGKVRWVREHLPRAKRIKIGGASAWYERDIIEFIESQREAERLAETRRVASGE